MSLHIKWVLDIKNKQMNCFYLGKDITKWCFQRKRKKKIINFLRMWMGHLGYMV